jgi:hypothetical protein
MVVNARGLRAGWSFAHLQAEIVSTAMRCKNGNQQSFIRSVLHAAATADLVNDCFVTKLRSSSKFEN